MSAVTESWWRGKGFAECPRFQEGTGNETVWRVCGGPTSLIFGSCYSFTKPTSVSAAEFDANIVKWGNLCRYFVGFQVRKGTPLWVGRIDQTYERADEDDGKDAFVWGNNESEQVWIDPKRAMSCLTLLHPIQPLRQDVTVFIPRQRFAA